MSVKTKYLQVFTTFPNQKMAEKTAKVLVKEKLAACVQILGPLFSFYRWQGELKKSKEFLCIIKTTSVKYKDMEKLIKSTHPYDIPEIIVLPILEGSKEYLKWVNNQI